MNAYIKKSVRAMHGYAPGEQPTDPRVIKLNTNESPYPPSPAVREALQSLKAETLRLYPDPVSLILRRKIAEEQDHCVPQLAQLFQKDKIFYMPQMDGFPRWVKADVYL